MASKGYTKTGNGWLATAGNWLSMLGPFGAWLGAPLLAIDTGITAIGWILRGKPLSALTAIGSGSVATLSAAMTSNPVWWGVNLLSGVTTGRTINTNLRGFTEGATDMVTKPLGIEPTVLRSYTAGMGSNPNYVSPTPGQFARMEAERRGRNAQEMYDAHLRNEGGVAVAQQGGQASLA